MVETFGTNHVPEEAIERAVAEVFDLRPGAIIDELDLRRPIYRKTAAYGHFGRELPEFTWETHRPRRRPAGGLRGRVTWLRLSRRGDARHSDSLRQSSLAAPSIGADLGRPSQPRNVIPLRGLTKVSPYGSPSKTPSFISERAPVWGPFAVLTRFRERRWR